MPSSKKRGIFSFFSSSKKSMKEKAPIEEKNERGKTVDETRSEQIEGATTTKEPLQQSNGQVVISSNDKEQSAEATKSRAERIPSTKKHRAPDPPFESPDESENAKLDDDSSKAEEISASNLHADDDHAEAGSCETQHDESGSSNVDDKVKVEDVSEKNNDDIKELMEERKDEAATKKENISSGTLNSDPASRGENQLEAKPTVAEVNLDDVFPVPKETGVVVNENLRKPSNCGAQEVHIVVKENVSVRQSVGKIEAQRPQSQTLQVCSRSSKSTSPCPASSSSESGTLNSPPPNASQQKQQTSTPPLETNRDTKPAHRYPNENLSKQRPKSSFEVISATQSAKRSSDFFVADNAAPLLKSKRLGSRMLEEEQAGSDNVKLQREYNRLKMLFDEWKLLCSDLEMQKNPQTLKLQTELMEQLKYVQELCASSEHNAPPNITMPLHMANIKKRPPIGKYSFSPPSPQTLKASEDSIKKSSKKISRSSDFLSETVNSTCSIPEERESEEGSHKDSSTSPGPPHSFTPLLKTQFISPRTQEATTVPHKSKNDFSKPVHIKASSYNGIVKPTVVSSSKDSRGAINSIAEETRHDKWNGDIRPDEKGWVTSTLRLGGGIKKSDDKELALLRIQHEIEMETKRQNEVIRMRKQMAGRSETAQNEAKFVEDIQPEVEKSTEKTKVSARKIFSANQKPETTPGLSEGKRGSALQPISMSIFNGSAAQQSSLQNTNISKGLQNAKQRQGNTENVESRTNTGSGFVSSKKLEIEKKREVSLQIQSGPSKNFKPSTEPPKSSAQANGLADIKKQFEPVKSDHFETKRAPINTKASQQRAYVNKGVLANQQPTNTVVSLVGINAQPQKNNNDDKPKQNSAPKIITHETKKIIQQSHNASRAKLDIVVNPSCVYSQSTDPSGAAESYYESSIPQTMSVSVVSKQVTTTNSEAVTNSRTNQQRNSVPSQFGNNNPPTVPPPMGHLRGSVQLEREINGDYVVQRGDEVANHESNREISDGMRFVMPHLKKVGAPVERTGFKLGTVLNDKDATERFSSPGTSPPSSPDSHYDVPMEKSSNFTSVPPPPPGPAPSISSLPSPGRCSSSSSIPVAPRFPPLSSSLSTPLSSTPNSSHSSLLPFNPGDDYERKVRIPKGLSPMTTVDPAILMAEMKKVQLRPAAPVARIRQSDSREDLMQEIRLAGGIKSLRKTSAKA